MQDFKNETLDVSGFPKYEEVPLNALSKKYWNVVMLELVIFLLFLATTVTAVLYFVIVSRPYIYVACAVYVIFSIILILLYRTDIGKRGFAVREKDILYRSGIIAISTTIIPFSRIQHISLHEGLFSRMYELGELRIFTAGGSSGSLHIPGIEIEQAKQIKTLLMQQINTEDNAD